MTLLQPKLSLKVSQRQILTPGLMQMVSVLALNKLELKEMINSEIVENPVLEELEGNVPLLDEIAGKEADRDRSVQDIADEAQREKKDPFDEIDFGSYFQDYLDPGFRTPNSFELSEKPSFENFLSQPHSLCDHLCWQLGSLNVPGELRGAAEYIIGNLNEDGYLTASDEELLDGFVRQPPREGRGAVEKSVCRENAGETTAARAQAEARGRDSDSRADGAGAAAEDGFASPAALLAAAVSLVQSLDPPGVAARDLRECLLAQLETARRELRPPPVSAREREAAAQPDSIAPEARSKRCETLALARRIVDEYLPMLQKRDLREMSKALGETPGDVQRAIDLIRTLDPRPGQRFNSGEPLLIEPDVAFLKRDEAYVVVMNDEDLPVLRLNQGYRKLLSQDGAEREVKDYVKERYRSALQLMRNIEQRKNTILRTCEAIVRRQGEFLERGVEALKPMMIKEVAEEIGVHPSTVSRAVSSKYVHTPQGVFELRFFFSEAVNGPEGGGTPLMLLKRKVKKFIEDEDPRKPLTDDTIASRLQAQGIDVTRRTVAKYREDLRIPSTHQRRVRN